MSPANSDVIIRFCVFQSFKLTISSESGVLAPKVVSFLAVKIED